MASPNIIDGKIIEKIEKLTGEPGGVVVMRLIQYARMRISAVAVLKTLRTLNRYPTQWDCMVIQQHGLGTYMVCAKAMTKPANFMYGQFTYN